MPFAHTISPALLAAILMCSGIIGLRLGWRKPSKRMRLTVLGGWLVLAIAGYVAILAWGLELGISYALGGIALCGGVTVFLNRSVHSLREDKPGNSRAKPLASDYGHRWLTFITAGPLAGLASCQFVLACAVVMPGSEITRMATSAILFPILWGIVAAVSCMFNHPGRQAIIFLLIAALSSLLVYL